ncbi:hypothetical protein M430DRAFT_188830 [Amorphotheca resinae ATCC 22711]|jgi:hypothetical protein|uniref:Uncharacterized protein n=1 Tax=Amorphotheca resinae ATCC 22711 TaxID=857342 RepID=A0A2T3AR53_AMORE|nr:hypothetical protein M430DRAFT_188830 [Amorphotheca resinae ATCC 22711]PSS08748.1 hypothetical protein M430DRAFT_188830 [Amorphotheca resinae ATCC 22711]
MILGSVPCAIDKGNYLRCFQNVATHSASFTAFPPSDRNHLNMELSCPAYILTHIRTAAPSFDRVLPHEAALQLPVTPHTRHLLNANSIFGRRRESVMAMLEPIGPRHVRVSGLRLVCLHSLRAARSGSRRRCCCGLWMPIFSRNGKAKDSLFDADMFAWAFGGGNNDLYVVSWIRYVLSSAQFLQPRHVEILELPTLALVYLALTSFSKRGKGAQHRRIRYNNSLRLH